MVLQLLNQPQQHANSSNSNNNKTRVVQGRFHVKSSRAKNIALNYSYQWMHLDGHAIYSMFRYYRLFNEYRLLTHWSNIDVWMLLIIERLTKAMAISIARAHT